MVMMMSLRGMTVTTVMALTLTSNAALPESAAQIVVMGLDASALSAAQVQTPPTQPPEPPPEPPPPSETAADDQAAPAEPAPPSETQPQAQPEPEPETTVIERDPIKRMQKQIDALELELRYTRQQLAEAVLRAASALRDLDELQQFIADHRDFGNDFTQYKGVKDAAEKEAKRKEAEAAKARRDSDRAEREARMRAARAEKLARDAQVQKAARYRRSGFSPLGLEVYSGKWAFYYETTDTTRSRIDYNPGIGNYVRLYPDKRIDYSEMTISGSVLNGSDEVRNVGVAITFFDEHGNQVGQETVQVSNARPDVPYPFTSKIEMALDRPFDTSSTYVLYADPVAEEDAGPSTTSTNAAPANTATTRPGEYRTP